MMFATKYSTRCQVSQVFQINKAHFHIRIKNVEFVENRALATLSVAI